MGTNGNGPHDDPYEDVGTEPDASIKYNEVVASNGQLACKNATIAVGGCGRYAVEVCLTCKQAFCPDHASSIDPLYCSDCLSPQTTELNKEPLTEVTPDGTVITHKGVHITTKGVAFKSLATRISTMADDELRSFIREERVKVIQAEKVRDYHRIAMSGAQVEEEFRSQDQLRKLRGTAVPSAQRAMAKATNGSGVGSPKKGINDLAAVFAAGGAPMNQDTLQKLAAFLASKKTTK